MLLGGFYSHLQFEEAIFFSLSMKDDSHLQSPEFIV